MCVCVCVCVREREREEAINIAVALRYNFLCTKTITKLPHLIILNIMMSAQTWKKEHNKDKKKAVNVPNEWCIGEKKISQYAKI